MKSWIVFSLKRLVIKMNCPLCGKNAVALFSSIECGTIHCSNFNAKQFVNEIVGKPMKSVFDIQFTSTSEDVEKGIFKAVITIPAVLDFIYLDNKEPK